MEEEKFKKLLEELQLLQERLYHHSDETAHPIIDKFIEDHPEILQVHEREWFYKNL
jgi:hypothetical protein